MLNCGVLVCKVGFLCWRGNPKIGIDMAFSWFSSKHTQIIVVGVVTLVVCGALGWQPAFVIPELKGVNTTSNHVREPPQWINPIHDSIISIDVHSEVDT
jgi:hypothetical protein